MDYRISRISAVSPKIVESKLLLPHHESYKKSTSSLKSDMEQIKSNLQPYQIQSRPINIPFCSSFVKKKTLLESCYTHMMTQRGQLIVGIMLHAHEEQL